MWRSAFCPYSVLLLTCLCLRPDEASPLSGPMPSPSPGKFPCRQVNATFVDCSRLGLPSVPDGIPEATEILLLSHNRLQITSGSLSGLVNLRVLNLSHNIISKFRGGSYFSDQGQLERLDLSNNQINRIPDATFSALANLRSLDLSAQNNGLQRGFPEFLRPVAGTLTTLRIDEIGAASADFGSLSLRSLVVLSLAGNKLSRLGGGDFLALSGAHLQTLDLSRNSISAIDVEVFSPLAGIGSLDLTSFTANPHQPMLLPNVSKAAGATEIQRLVLSGLGLTSLVAPMFESLGNSTLKELDLSSNRIVDLGEGSFGTLARLEELNLSNNLIGSLSPESLSGLAHLKTLDLDTNSLTGIEPGTFQHNSSLERLYLSNNSITALSPDGSFRGLVNLEVLHLSSNKLSQTFEGGEFQDLGELRYLDLGRSKINTGHVVINYLSFRYLPKLKYLNLKKVNLANILSVPSPFHTLPELRFLDMSNNNMNSFPESTFDALKSLETLYLDHNHFNLLWVPQQRRSVSLFLRNLVSLRQLDLSFNGFESVPGDAFKNLTRLKSLHLSNNKLSAISSQVFGSQGQLEYLDLHKNVINVVNQTMLAPVRSLKWLGICDNPFSCSCQQEWFRNWIEETDAVLLNRSRCLCDSPPEWRNKPLLSYHPDEFLCDGKLPLWAWVSVGCASFLVLVLVTVAYVKRWKIVYVGLVVKAHFRRARRRRNGDYQELYDYDAFVSHSAADEEWVTQRLLPELEGGPDGFRLCYHVRDFEPGREVVDNIIHSVERSCRTICVITTSYLESHWCTYERRITLNKLFVSYRDALILVVLEDIPDEKMSKYDLIHRSIKRKTYLKWPANPEEQPVFWQKLKDVLKEDRHPENNEVLPINA